MDRPQFTPTFRVGSNTPDTYIYLQWVDVVTSIIVWDNGSRITGVQLLCTRNNSPPLLGDKTGTLCRLDLQQAELIQTLTMWPTSDGSALAKIVITTNLGQTFAHGTQGSNSEAQLCQVGSGIMCGMNGSANSGVLASLGFKFFLPIKSIQIADLAYPNDPSGLSDGISIISLSHATYSNPGADPIQFSFKDTVTKTNTTEYSVALADTYGVSATVKGEFLGISLGATPSWEKTTEKTTTSTTSTDIALQWGLTGDLASGKSVSCTATCAQAAINVDFTCSILVTFVDPTIPVMLWWSNGVAKNVLYTNVTAGIDGT